MTALLRKDFYIIKGQLGMIGVFALVLSFFLPGMELFGSTYLMVFAIVMPTNTLFNDEQSRWDSYAAMLPFRSGQIVLGKYVLTWALGILGLAAGLLLRCIHALYGNAPVDWTEEILSILAVFVLAVIGSAFSIPIMYRFGTQKGRVATMLLLFATFAGIFLGFSGDNGAAISTAIESVPPWFLGVALAGAVVLLNGISFKLSVRFYTNRRDGVYS